MYCLMGKQGQANQWLSKIICTLLHKELSILLLVSISQHRLSLKTF